MLSFASNSLNEIDYLLFLFACFSSSLNGTAFGYLTRPVNEDTEAIMPLGALWPEFLLLLPFPNTHLTLKLVCVEGPIQIHGFCSWSHFTSDAVHIVIVVDSLEAEKGKVSSFRPQ